MRMISLFLLLVYTPATFAQNKKEVNQKEKVEYTKHRKVDLGALSVEGEIVVPGDFSIDDKEEDETSGIYRRKNYKDRYSIYYKFVF